MQSLCFLLLLGDYVSEKGQFWSCHESRWKETNTFFCSSRSGSGWKAADLPQGHLIIFYIISGTSCLRRASLHEPVRLSKRNWNKLLLREKLFSLYDCCNRAIFSHWYRLSAGTTPMMFSIWSQDVCTVILYSTAAIQRETERESWGLDKLKQESEHSSKGYKVNMRVINF